MEKDYHPSPRNVDIRARYVGMRVQKSPFRWQRLALSLDPPVAADCISGLGQEKSAVIGHDDLLGDLSRQIGG